MEYKPPPNFISLLLLCLHPDLSCAGSVGHALARRIQVRNAIVLTLCETQSILLCLLLFFILVYKRLVILLDFTYTNMLLPPQPIFNVAEIQPDF